MTVATSKLRELGYATIYDNYTDLELYSMTCDHRGKILREANYRAPVSFLFNDDKTISLSEGIYSFELLSAILMRARERGDNFEQIQLDLHDE